MSKSTDECKNAIKHGMRKRFKPCCHCMGSDGHCDECIEKSLFIRDWHRTLIDHSAIYRALIGW